MARIRNPRWIALFSLAILALPACGQRLSLSELPDSPSASQSSTSSQAPADGKSTTLSVPDESKMTPEEKHRLAQQQLEAQTHQRVGGVMAAFNTTQNREALPLSAGQKFELFFKSATDPWPFLLAGANAGIGQAKDSNPEWGQGIKGYGHRTGAAYGDYVIGNFFGNALLPAWWHEDPRYFQMGHGMPMKRILWAAASCVWSRRDNGSWGPNYANVAGNLIGTSITRVTYYPASTRTVGDTIEDGFVVTFEGIVGAEVIEWWPDAVRRHRRKQAEKLARQDAAAQARSGSQAPRSHPQNSNTQQ